MKGMVLPGTLFEEFGFNYIGPIDGHDLDTLVHTLANVRDAFRAAVPARHHQEGLRLSQGRRRPDPLSRRQQVRSRGRHRGQARRQADATRRSSATGCATWRRRDPRVVGITPAMREGSGLVRFSQEYPERYFDVGIAEQHAVTFAAGLACEGMQPGGRDLFDVPAARVRPARSTTSCCRTCRSCSRSTARVSSAPTARRTSAPSTSRTCAACPTRR